MAILASLPGVEVTVTVSSSALPELEGEAAPITEDTVTRYIEVQSGQVFEIKVVTGRGATRGAGLDYEIYIDGECSSRMCIASEDCEDEEYVCVSRGWCMGDGNIRQYKMTVFETDDIDGIKEQTEKTKKLGLIEVKVFHLSGVTEIARTTTAGNFSRDGSVPLEPISEKAVKFQELSHTVGKGEIIERKGKATNTCDVDITYASHHPIGTFQFLYRSKEKLKNLHVLARTPPPPSIEEREAASLNENDVGELQRRLREANEQMEAMRRIKREEQKENQNRRPFARPPGDEVINLEEDAVKIKPEVSGRKRPRSSAISAGSFEAINLEDESVQVRREALDGNSRPIKAARRSEKSQTIDWD